MLSSINKSFISNCLLHNKLYQWMEQLNNKVILISLSSLLYLITCMSILIHAFEFDWKHVAELMNLTHPKFEGSVPPITEEFEREFKKRWESKMRNPIFMEFLYKKSLIYQQKNKLPTDQSIDFVNDYKHYLENTILANLTKIPDPQLRQMIAQFILQNRTDIRKRLE
ncbi:uncharacterized protein LOC142330543 [Lycorma delicatula]|uniref:uncharacterized protein LOC142330543 n=1 Tax=Lycorma delicatula TaxID=130591 RepID=UPI003F512F96